MALLDITDVEAHYGATITGGAYEDVVEAWIAALDAEVVGVVGPLELVTDDVLTLRPERAVGEVYVRCPLAEEPTVTVDGEDAEVRWWARSGKIDLASCVSPGQEIVVTFTAGWDPIPADVVGRLAAKLAGALRARVIAAASSSGGAGSMVTGSSSGSRSVTYAAPSDSSLDFMSDSGMSMAHLTDDDRLWLRRRFGMATGSPLIRP